MALPDKGVSIEMIANELNADSTNLGVLALHPNVNKWSRWKPVPFWKIDELTEMEIKGLNFGLVPPVPSTDYRSIVNQKWTYNRPNGNEYEPFRLPDFHNYEKTATPIAKVMESIELNTSNISDRDIALMMNITGSNYIIGINDFVGEIGDYYYGVVFESGISGNTVHAKSATLPLSEGGSNFKILMDEAPFSTLQTNPIKLYHLLFSVAVPNMVQLSSISPPYFLPVPTADEDSNIMEITTKTGSDFSITFTDIGRIAGAAMNPISPYMGIDSIPFITPDHLYFKAALWNTYQTSKTFEAANLKISANPNYFGMSSYVSNAVLTDSNGTSITSISVPAGETRIVNIGADNLLNRDGDLRTTPPYGIEIYSEIKIIRGEDRLASYSMKFKSN